MNMTEAIIMFAIQHRAYATPKGSYNMCCTSVQEFTDFLSYHGVKGVALEYSFDVMSRNKDEYINPNPRAYRWNKKKAEYHMIVDLGFCYLDWTARQYCAILPFPYIIPKRKEDANEVERLLDSTCRRAIRRALFE